MIETDAAVNKEKKTITEIDNLPVPFMGRIIIEMIKESVSEYKKKLRGVEKFEGLSNSGFVIADGEIDKNTGEFRTKVTDENLSVPFKKGKIVKLAKDAFGDYFQSKYGKDTDRPTIGDTIWFIPFQSYQVDLDDKYHIVNDHDVIAFERGKK